MDVTQIISIILSAIIPSGGIAALFMIRGRRKELEISNLSQVIAKWKEIAEDRKHRSEEFKADIEELKTEIDKKDEKIDQLYALISQLRETLDHTRTNLATAEMMICDRTRCANRTPPFGTGREYLQTMAVNIGKIGIDSKK